MAGIAIQAIALEFMVLALLAYLYYVLEIKGRQRYIPDEYRKYVLWRDQGKCRMCGSTDNLHVDHIIPFARRGTNELANLQILCRICNLKKGASIP